MKQFLKPTGGKVIIAFVLFCFALFFFASCASYETQPGGWHYPCGTTVAHLFNYLQLPGTLALNIIISYLISCLGVWIFGKLKRKFRYGEGKE
ncbi:MAG: hypothetical protein Q8N56_01865 [bacterium]|nr:hypothetical protein [bacterium]